MVGGKPVCDRIAGRTKGIPLACRLEHPGARERRLASTGQSGEGNRNWGTGVGHP
jgi:hypothetical protein